MSYLNHALSCHLLLQEDTLIGWTYVSLVLSLYAEAWLDGMDYAIPGIQLSHIASIDECKLEM